MAKLHAPTGRPDAAALDIIDSIRAYAGSPVDSDDDALQRIESLRHVFFEAECAWEQSLDEAKNDRSISWKRLMAATGLALSTLQGRVKPGVARALRDEKRAA